MQAFQVLSDPKARAKYDARYERQREARWRIFDQDTAANDLSADRRVRTAILSLLYTARRNDADRPGIGVLELEKTAGWSGSKPGRSRSPRAGWTACWTWADRCGTAPTLLGSPTPSR